MEAEATYNAGLTSSAGATTDQVIGRRGFLVPMMFSSVKEELVNEELVNRELVNGESVKEELVKEELVNDELLKEEPVIEEVVTEEQVSASEIGLEAKQDSKAVRPVQIFNKIRRLPRTVNTLKLL